MSDPSSQITFAGVSLSGFATLGLRVGYDKVPGGASVLRMANGDAVRQEFWDKALITLTCTGVAPSGLKGLDYDQTFTLIVPDPDDPGATGLPQSASYTVYASLREEHDINGAVSAWTLVCEEA